MKNIFVVLLAVVLSVTASHFLLPGNHTATTKKETSWDRIIRTNTIRCGYYVYPPVTYRDPNTGKLSGLSVDMMEKVAKRAGLNVEWTEEVNFGNWQLGLQSNRFDMACTPMWPNTAMGRVVYFTQPFFYSAIYAIGRSNDDRFKTLDDLNKENISVATQEGNEMLFLAQDVFPKAKLKANAPNADGNLIGFDVITKKADFLLSDKNLIKELNKTNPNALKILVDHPVKMMPFTLAVGTGEDQLLQFVNNATNEMVLTGEIDSLIKKWVPGNDIYIPVAPSWKSGS
jgi:ABC-type amino acid transport substrate-binding protein